MFVFIDPDLSRRPDRRGFALPLAILGLALVTAAVAASSAATRAEIVANQAVRAQDRAYQLAEAGLQQFMARRGEAGWCDNCVTNPSTNQYKTDSTETDRVSLAPYGYAQVVSVRVRPRVLGDSVAIFFIYSRGVDTTVKMSGAGVTQFAERTLGQYATFRTKGVKPTAAVMSVTGLTKNSNTSAIDGNDECGVEPAIPGLAVPTGEYRKGGGVTVDPIGSVGVSTMSADALKALLGIDWDAILNKRAIPPDYTVPTVAWPGASWAVTRVTTNPYTIPSDGNGILIVDGDLTLTGTRDFDGIVLVGGKITVTGSQPSSGIFLAGLNYLLPGAGNPPASSADDVTLTSTKSFRYNSCNVATAMSLLAKYFAWSNTWLDNVATW